MFLTMLSPNVGGCKIVPKKDLKCNFLIEMSIGPNRNSKSDFGSLKPTSSSPQKPYELKFDWPVSHFPPPPPPPHAVQTSMLSRGFCGFCKNDAFFFKKRKKHHEGFAIFVKTTSFFSKSANNSRGFCYFCKNDALFFKKRKKLTRILRFFLKRRVFFQKAQKTHEDFAIFVKKQRFFQKRKKLTRFLRFL